MRSARVGGVHKGYVQPHSSSLKVYNSATNMKLRALYIFHSQMFTLSKMEKKLNFEIY